jgi:hypothetical protein
MAERDVEGLLRWSLVCMSLAAAVIHAQAAADHRGFPVHVGFFLVAAAVQSALAAAVLRRPSARWLAAIAACNGAVAAVWVLSRTVGLPVEGATLVESIGFKDGIAVLLEVGICAAAGLLGTLPEAARRVALAAGPLASTVIAATVWGLAVSGLMARHTHDGHTHLNGGDVQAVADHHGPSHVAGDHHETPASVDRPEPDHGAPEHGTHEHQADEAHDGHPAPVGGDRHIHQALAVVHRHASGTEAATRDDGPAEHHDGTHHAHDSLPTPAAADDDDGDGHGPGHGGHGHDPGDHPGAGERDPDDDRSGVGRVIDDAIRLLEPDGGARFSFPHTTRRRYQR